MQPIIWALTTLACTTFWWVDIVTGNNMTVLQVCLLIEQGNPDLMYSYKRSAAAIDMAVEYANEIILAPNMQMKIFNKDGGSICGVNNLAVRRALQWTQEGVRCDIYIGPGCDRAVSDLYTIASYRNVPIIGCPASNVVGHNDVPRVELPLMIRLAYSFTDLCKMLITFLDTFSYTHTTTFADQAFTFFLELGNAFNLNLRQGRSDLYKKAKFVNFRSDEALDDDYKSLLKESQLSSRVIILFANSTIVRRVMLHALELGMTQGDYAYMAVELFQSTFWGEFTWKFGDKQDLEARTAFGSLSLIALYDQRNQAFVEFEAQVRKRSREKYGYIYGAFEQVDPIVTSFYDAFILYADVVKRMYKAGGNLSDGMALSAAFRNASVTSPLNYQITMDAMGDRLRTYAIKSLNNETAAKYDEILVIDYHNHQEMWYGQFTIAGHSGLPPDIPHCGFDGQAAICIDTKGMGAGSIAGIIVGVIIVVIVGGGLVVFNTFLNSDGFNNDPYWWRIRTDDLRFNEHIVPHASRKSVNNSTMTESREGSERRSQMSNIGILTAIYDDITVALMELAKHQLKPSVTSVKELNEIRGLAHPNIQRFIGLCLDEQNFFEYVVGEVCVKGTLEDVLENDHVKLDWSFKNSLLKDIVDGMIFLHSSPVGSHGQLTGFNCLIDSRFVVKIAAYGLPSIFMNPDNLLPPTNADKERDFSLLLWRAPELLRLTMPPKGTQEEQQRLSNQKPACILTLMNRCFNCINKRADKNSYSNKKGDVYSYAIIMQQIIMRCGPYSSALPGHDHTDVDHEKSKLNGISHKEIVLEVKGGGFPPLRPQVPRSLCLPDLYTLMEQCWAEMPIERPPFLKIKETMKRFLGKDSDNIIDSLLRRMEQYANNLEAQVAEKTQQFMEEKRRSEELLSQLLPKSIAAALTKGQSIDPETFDSVTIYFSDIVGFTTISAAISPMDVVTLLNNLYTLFDGILGGYDVYKVETIGDGYMVASGLPVRNGHRHANEVAKVSLQIQHDITRFVVPKKPKEHLQVRIGAHSGSCVAGIVGLKMPRYCLFGDTINTAARMESTGEAMKIQISGEMKDLLDLIGGFIIRERGAITVKGKGVMTTYWLQGTTT